ncbi:magnesium chelatase [Janibacter sp. Soil728]|uniref:magnesium chelatase subunit D family protein n=1 Tax=Janibacter sp. Soil728 TaxID=1736393 RepID=UPI0006FC2598|nr:magnesium chelatase subunit D family protein [Janibacter sp. Soil728]KRE38431.1 magnesium chelatase [Janibacter sp. Soil728]
MTAPVFPFTALVGSDELITALLLSAISPEIGGVLVRGEKGTAKSTAVRALAAVLPEQQVAVGCRFGCDPERTDDCPDGPHTGPATTRPARLVELPVGATEDRVVGSLDLRRALGEGEAAYQPGLLADAHRGILYVDEVNLLHDHLVDVLLDAAAMGRNTVERDGVSISHPARITLVGTMNPEEGELRPQLLDRFGLTVHVAASRDPHVRAEVVRRRLAADLDPAGFADGYATSEAALTERLAAARESVTRIRLEDATLQTIARVCAGFDVDGMRADIVTARTAVAHAAWAGREHVSREDIRAAALLALPHRRRRAPFDAPGLDEDLLDRLLDEEPEDEPPGGGEDAPDGGPASDTPEGGPSDSGRDSPGESPERPTPPDPARDPEARSDTTDSTDSTDSTDPTDSPGESRPEADHPPAGALPTPTGTASAQAPFRARRLELSGVGSGPTGRRSPALTPRGRVVGTHPAGLEPAGSPVHLTATLRASAARRAGRTGPARVTGDDLRHAITRGREANLVLLAVDASGSMAARKRMGEVKTAVLSLLLDAYQRRDRVGLVTFRGAGAEVALPPTSSVDAAAARLAELPHGGRTPLAEGLTEIARVVARERIRDRNQRALVIIVTDGRATAGPDALARAQHIADAWGHTADTVVVDCESGRFRMGLAADLAHRMGAEHIALEQVAASGLVEIVTDRTGSRRSAA